MTVSVSKDLENIKQSLVYFLRHEQYTKGGETKTLKEFFQGLVVEHAFPDNLENLTLPFIGIEFNTEPSVSYPTFGYKLNEYSFSIYGFCGGHDSVGLNRLQRDQLMNDIKRLLEEKEYLPYYEFPDFSSSSEDLEVTDVNARTIEPTSPVQAERWRFVIDLTLKKFRN